MSNFETWWEREGQEFLYALNTTTDDDIKLVAEFAWKNGAYCAEQTEQEPVAVVEITYGREPECYVTGNIDDFPEGVFKLYAAPVEPVQQEPVAWNDLTDDEIAICFIAGEEVYSGRQVIAAFKEKNTAPVRTKDLTDDEIRAIRFNWERNEFAIDFARAVIAAYKEKNK